MTHLKGRDLLDRAGPQLRTRWIGRETRGFNRLASTNSEALEWARDGAPHGALVYAEHQTRGRGRFGRSWEAHAGLNLTFSIVLRPEFPPDQWTLITIAACVAVCESIDRFAAPFRSAVTWPNDILLNEKKCCGTLLETYWRAGGRSSDPAVILGIGLNVNQIDFPAEISDRATSLRLQTGRTHDRAALLASMLEHLEARLDLTGDRPSEVRGLYLSRMLDLNESVSLQFAGRTGSVRGVAAGLDASGGLMLQTDSGLEVFHAGEVTRSR